MIIDIAFLLIIVIACVKGYRTGLIIALFSIIGFIAGIAAALKFSTVVAEKLGGNFNNLGKWLPFISFLLVFLVVIVIVNLGAKLIQKSVELVLLGWLNRIGGIVLYLLLYSILFSIFLFFMVQLKILSETTISSSKLYPVVQPVGPFVINSIGSIIPWFKGIFIELQEFFNKLPVDINNK